MNNGQAALAAPPPRGPQHPERGESASDAQLLERFAVRREQAAFAALVKRHARPVLTVCRRLLQHEQDAEDVSQAVFLVLAHKAGVLPWQENITGWLCAVATRLALNARAVAARRRRHEKPDDEEQVSACFAADGDPLAEVARRELRQLLDDELHQLPEKYRAPVVLCYLEGKTNAEAAQELGWPVGSMSRRLARARSLLKERLTRRGLVLATCTFALLLAGLFALRAILPVESPASPVSVAQVMSRFKAPGANGADIETTLCLLAEGKQHLPAPAEIHHLAEQTAEAAEQIKRHHSGPRGAEWLQLTDEMRRSALDLARAARGEESGPILLAARRLNASCKKCHEVFRN
jgi:RNA polymerase sigma-70 factor (ECF subfamily)